MNYINRPKYIERIQKFVDKPIIKVLTGMRRVGKSTILTIIKNEILRKVPSQNKIYLNFESTALFGVRDAAALLEYLQPLFEQLDGKLYFFFDEIQLVRGWERVINGLAVDLNCDIYLTGSNATLISGDLATLLAGRYVAFEIQPFTFSEFSHLFDSSGLTQDALFDKFIALGGMPFLKHFALEQAPSYKYLNDVYNTVLVKDVLDLNYSYT